MRKDVDAVTSATFGLFDLSTIRVTIATLKCSAQPEQATKFAEFCAFDEAAKLIWTEAGFSLPRGASTQE